MSYESLKSAAREAAKGMGQVREAVRLGFEMKRDLEARQKQQEENEKLRLSAMEVKK